MAADEEDTGIEAGVTRRPRWRRWLLFAGLMLGLGLILAWLGREQIADDVIAGQLDSLGLPATYEIEQVSTDMQVLRNIVIGDPQRPDLTIERVRVAFVPRFGVPGVGRITLEKPRLFGTYRDGKLSFGSLDRLIFTGSKLPFRLPDLDLAVVDGRALLESDHGDFGFKLAGQGPLRGGFSGELAAVAPTAQWSDCAARDASLFGQLTVSNEKPRFVGPVRLAGLACKASALRLGKTKIGLDLTLAPQFDGADGQLGLAIGTPAFGSGRAASTSGKARFAWRGQALTADYELHGARIETPQAAMAALSVTGAVRAQDNFARAEITGDAKGSGLRLGGTLDSALAGSVAAAQGTFAAPLIAQLRGGLSREGRNSRFTGSFIHRQTGSVANLVVPQASVIGSSGKSLLTVSRVQLRMGGADAPRLTGNFVTGGAGLPRISGRMERAGSGTLAMRLRMADYAAGGARLALPQMMLVQSANGALGFAGTVRMSGALPGGAASNLALPVEGNWSRARGLAVGRKCASVTFDRLTLATLALRKHDLTLCPQRGAPMLALDGRGMRLAAGIPSLDLAGMLKDTPIQITSGAAGFAWPGTLTMRALDVAIGDRADPSRFRVADLKARLGERIAGTFAGGQVELSQVPLDVLDGAGMWSFAQGRLALDEVTFRLEDRERDDRFQPLVAQGASLLLADNQITAQAAMREPKGLREVVRADIGHDLDSGIGRAGLTMAGLLFDKQLQPEAISRLILGVVAFTGGTVRGNGRIDWTPLTTTSTGSFSTDGLDFAAAFGPAKGVSGTIAFTDLLGLVTAPDQRLKIAAINPGVVVENGELRFEMLAGNVLSVLGARWPFFGGTLTLKPVKMQIGVAETRRYELRIEGIDAAKFVERMDMGNILASGTFDGVIPIVFDENGGRLDGGQLVSRPPGGNVSYVGALTYEDISPMANFAFDALKSLNYRKMQIDLNGPLEGEIVTRVSFDGIAQGERARRNFVTRQIAKLPIKFNVNLRAPFFKLVGSVRSLFDPSFVRDPREVGLIVKDLPQPAPSVQPSVSEKGL